MGGPALHAMTPAALVLGRGTSAGSWARSRVAGTPTSACAPGRGWRLSFQSSGVYRRPRYCRWGRVDAVNLGEWCAGSIHQTYAPLSAASTQDFLYPPAAAAYLCLAFMVTTPPVVSGRRRAVDGWASTD